MKDGAFGLSSMLAMPPGSLATPDDIAQADVGETTFTEVRSGEALGRSRTTAH